MRAALEVPVMRVRLERLRADAREDFADWAIVLFAIACLLAAEIFG